MENIVKSYDFVSMDEDLNYCEEGVVYQKDMSKSVDYDKQYFQNYVERANTFVANALNKARVDISHTYCNCLVDVGIGSGEFIINSKVKTYGYDINPVGVEWLKQRNIFVDPYQEIPSDVMGWTFWDVIEHIPEPQHLFEKIPSGHYIFVSIPIFENLKKIRENKHFKPNEHYYYFTKNGFIQTICNYGFEFLESNDHETLAGREGILTFAFRKF